eukprot:6785200-Prorocentrum_lima.AAC.1
MELLCASPYLTSCLFFHLELREGGGVLFDAPAHAPRRRVGARGNAITLPMPWEDVLEAMEDLT